MGVHGRTSAGEAPKLYLNEIAGDGHVVVVCLPVKVRRVMGIERIAADGGDAGLRRQLM